MDRYETSRNVSDGHLAGSLTVTSQPVVALTDSSTVSMPMHGLSTWSASSTAPTSTGHVEQIAILQKAVTWRQVVVVSRTTIRRGGPCPNTRPSCRSERWLGALPEKRLPRPILVCIQPLTGAPGCRLRSHRLEGHPLGITLAALSDLRRSHPLGPGRSPWLGRPSIDLPAG